MADIARQLLAAIESKLETLITSGEALEDVGSYFVLYTASQTPPDYGTMLPLIVVRLGQVTAQVATVSGCQVNKQYPVIFSVFTEDNGDNEDSTAAEILDILENEFYGNTLDLSQWVDVPTKDYTQTSLPPFSGDWNGSGEITFMHYDTDMREG